MAPIPCDLCQAEEATVLQTALVTGDTLGIGDTCLIGFYLGVLGELTAGMPREVAEAYSDPLAIIIKNISPSLLDLAATAKRKPRGGRAAAIEPTSAELAAAEAASDQADADVTAGH